MGDMLGSLLKDNIKPVPTKQFNTDENGFKYTEDQELAITQIKLWLNKPSDYFRVLTGQAGTGKTTIIKTILKDFNKTVVATAPTHKATHLLKYSLRCETATIQKLLGLRLSFDIYNIQEKNFTQQSTPAINKYKLVIIDEASMIPLELETLIKQEATNYKVKILFVGDKYQLKAVDGHSVFDSGYPTNTLNQIVRQEQDNPLIELLSIIRNDVQYKTTKFLDYLAKNPTKINGKKGFQKLTPAQLSAFVVNVYKNPKFYDDINVFKFLCYTNNTIWLWNDFIRKNIMQNQPNLEINPVLKGDFLLGYENIVDEYLSLILTNSEEYIVEDIKHEEKESGYYVFKLELLSKNTNKTSEIVVVDHTHPTFKVYCNILKDLILKAKSARYANRRELWKNVFDFKSKNLLMIDYQLNDWDKVSKALDYGYALTIHKSQGSTYKNVAVNLNDILFPNGKATFNKETIARLAYVAFSRANNMVYYI